MPVMFNDVRLVVYYGCLQLQSTSQIHGMDVRHHLKIHHKRSILQVTVNHVVIAINNYT